MLLELLPQTHKRSCAISRCFRSGYIIYWQIKILMMVPRIEGGKGQRYMSGSEREQECFIVLIYRVWEFCIISPLDALAWSLSIITIEYDRLLYHLCDRNIFRRHRTTMRQCIRGFRKWKHKYTLADCRTLVFLMCSS